MKEQLNILEASVGEARSGGNCDDRPLGFIGGASKAYIKMISVIRRSKLTKISNPLLYKKRATPDGRLLLAENILIL
jgi:hypothetical protein